jgi:hypothetical protein
MSWHCSRALVAAFSEATCSGGIASAPSSSTPTPEAYYWPDKTTEHSRLSRFGMTSEPLMADRGADLLMWFREAFLAKTYPPQARVTDWTASALACGRRWLGLLARFDHDSRSWRTPQFSLAGALDEFSETWPRSGSMRTGECWERQTLEPLTSGTESGLWPTPTANQFECRDMEALLARRERAKKKSGNGNGFGLTLANAVKLWPTPCARDYRHPGKSRMDRTGSKSGEVLPQIVGGPLNPPWVEWLMGWPSEWTDLRQSATDKFREWQQQHGACSLTEKEAA